MEVIDLTINPEEVVYLGSSKSSAFYWIGRFKDVPEKYLSNPVDETYKRSVGYAGTIIKTDTTKKGIYWNWNELNPDIEEYHIPCNWTPEGCERLIVALAKEAGRDYINDLNHELRKMPKKKRTSDRIEKMIQSVKTKDANKIEILVGTRIGDYILEHIEDEIRVKARCKEWDEMSYDSKTKYLISETDQLRKKRIRDSEKQLYASIRGKSVKHDMD